MADLEPFFVGSNDVIYGGLGNDFLHGGVGDDAISGAEALQRYYDDGRDPLGVLASLGYTLGNVLGLQPGDHDVPPVSTRTTRSAKIMIAPGIDFLLNFDVDARLRLDSPTVPVVDDGKDVLFGDVGNDWLVGGTNEDHLCGGYGDDLLQADDNLDTTLGTADPTANNTEDGRTVGPTFADFVFGGAGRDVLYANSYSDRLFDWSGEFNTYVIAYNPFGNPAINRAGNPSADELLYALSKSDGSDPTRGTDARQGEPYGEIGLLDPGDADIGDQKGGSRDPQNIKGAGRPDKGSIQFGIAVGAPSSAILINVQGMTFGPTGLPALTLAVLQALATAPPVPAVSVSVTVAVADALGAEAGSNPIVFTVTRTGITTGATSVTLVWSGSALTGDYTVAVTGATISANRLTLTFGAGQSVAIVTLTPVDDAAIEPQETVTLTVAAGAGYTVGAPASASGTIDDNDVAPPPPTVTVTSTSVAEGNKKSSTATVVVSLSAASTSTVTVVVSTVDGSALAGSDYAAVTRTLTFAPGVTSQSFAVSVSGDTTVEPNEMLFVRVITADGASGVGSQGSIAITNDDLPLTAVSAGAGGVVSLTRSQLEAVAAQALSDWAAARPDARLAGVEFSIGDLDGLLLGVASDADVTIDVDAAGWGWTISGGEMDLLTVVLHELGHVLGLDHDESGGLMNEALAPGDIHGLGLPQPTPAESHWIVSEGTAAMSIAGGARLGSTRLIAPQRVVIAPTATGTLRCPMPRPTLRPASHSALSGRARKRSALRA